jgi:hypothetical protein
MGQKEPALVTFLHVKIQIKEMLGVLISLSIALKNPVTVYQTVPAQAAQRRWMKQAPTQIQLQKKPMAQSDVNSSAALRPAAGGCSLLC